MKKYISLMLSLIFVLSLSSCAGIGDGALYGNDKTDGSFTCALALYDLRGELYVERELSGEGARELYSLFSASEYSESSEGDIPDKYVRVLFTEYDGNGEPVGDLFSMTGGSAFYIVRENDSVSTDNRAATHQYRNMGALGGIYDRLCALIGYSKNTVLQDVTFIGKLEELRSNGGGTKIHTELVYNDKAMELYDILANAEYVTVETAPKANIGDITVSFEYYIPPNMDVELVADASYEYTVTRDDRVRIGYKDADAGKMKECVIEGIFDMLTEIIDTNGNMP